MCQYANGLANGLRYVYATLCLYRHAAGHWHIGTLAHYYIE